jgi:hypothetical protein
LVREGPKNSTVLVATLTNGSSKAIRHVGVLVGAMEYEYDFVKPLAAGQTIRAIVGSVTALNLNAMGTKCHGLRVYRR